MKEKGLFTGPDESMFKSEKEVKRDGLFNGELQPIHARDFKKAREVKFWTQRAKERSEDLNEETGMLDILLQVNLPPWAIIALIGDLHFGNPKTDYQRIEDEVLAIKDSKRVSVVLGGDLVDGFFWGGYSQSEQSANLEEQYRFLNALFQELGGRIVVAVSGEHDCIDDKTQALTKRGWLNYNEIKQDDEFLTLNPETDFLEWHKYQYFHKYNVRDLSMVRMKTRDFDFFGTDNHRFFTQGRRNKKYSFKSALDFSRQIWGNEYIPTASSFGLEDYKIDDNVLGLLAWVIADGWLEKNRVRIGQRQEKANHIRKLLIDGDIPFTENTVKTKPIGDKIGDKFVKSRKSFLNFELKPSIAKSLILKILGKDKHVLPKLMWKLSDRQFDLFLRHFVLADGCFNGRDNSFIVYQKNEKFIDDLQSLCAMHNLRSTIYTYENEYGTQRRLNICKRKGMRLNSPKIISSHKKYTGVIWDITVTNGNFMVRRGGKSYFTGNSKWAAKTGIDPYVLMAEQCNAPYIRGIAEVSLNTGSQRYDLVTAHKLRGNSMYNNVHPQMRAGKELQGADIYSSHHTHCKGSSQQSVRNFGDSKVVSYISGGPYKYSDDYSERSGFAKQKTSQLFGHAILLNPDKKEVRISDDIIGAIKRW